MKKGFTIMELLISIAIITLLSTVVIIAVSATRDKGSDTNIQATLGQIRSETLIYREEHNGSYDALCGAGDPYRILEQRSEACFHGGYSVGDASCLCHDSEDAWVIAVPMKTDKYGDAWCVDSTNFGGPIDATRFSALSETTLCNSTVN